MLIFIMIIIIIIKIIFQCYYFYFIILFYYYYYYFWRHGGLVICTVAAQLEVPGSIPGVDPGAYCANEFACLPCICVDFLRVLRFSPLTVQRHSYNAVEWIGVSENCCVCVCLSLYPTTDCRAVEVLGVIIQCVSHCVPQSHCDPKHY